MSNPISGALYFMKGLKLLNKPGIRQWVIMPLIINFAMFSLLFWLGASQFNDFVNWLLASMPEWMQWLSWLLWPLFVISALLIGFFLFSILANIIAAPFNAYLSAAVERHLGGTGGTDAEQVPFFASIVPMISNEIRKAGYFLLLAIPLLILFVIPVVNVAAPILWFIYSAWVLSLEYVDYPFGNHNVEFKEVRGRMRGSRLAALGFGSSVNLAMMLPLFNFLVMPASVAAATVFWQQRLNLKAKSET